MISEAFSRIYDELLLLIGEIKLFAKINGLSVTIFFELFISYVMTLHALSGFNEEKTV